MLKCGVLMRWCATSVAVFVFSLALPVVVFASGSLSFSPASGSYSVGDEILLRVTLSSTEALAGAEGKVVFDPHAWSVEVSAAPDIASWAVLPRVDIEKGVVDFGALLNSEKAGGREVLTMHAKALRPGKQVFRFDAAATVAADGTGGNVLGSVTEASFDISPRVNDSGEGEVLGATTGSLIEISSPVVLDQSKWYAFSSSSVSLIIPKNIGRVLVGITKNEKDTGYRSLELSATSSEADSITVNREFGNLEEGVWYYHATPDKGGLIDTAHFRIAIDRTAPVVSSTTLRDRTDMSDPHLTVVLSATDTLSGIESVTASWNGGAPSAVNVDNNIAEIIAPGAGDHRVKFSFVDAAGNRSDVELPVTVTSLAPPKLSLVNGPAREAEPLVFRIEGSPGAKVSLEFYGGTVDYRDMITLNAQGIGEYVVKSHILPREYELDAFQVLSNGASSEKNLARLAVVVEVTVLGYLGRNPALAIAVAVTLLAAFGVLMRVAWKKYISRKPTVILALPAPTSSASARAAYPQLRTPQVVAPVAISRAPRVRGINPSHDVVDLRQYKK